MSWDTNPYHLNVSDHRLRGCSLWGIVPAKTNLPFMGYFLLVSITSFEWCGMIAADLNNANGQRAGCLPARCSIRDGGTGP